MIKIKKYELNFKGEKHPVNFKHLRANGVEGGWQLKGGKTIAFIKKNEEIVAQAEAICHPSKDAFSKKMGRVISFGRLKKSLS